jgi:hypothetical protein
MLVLLVSLPAFPETCPASTPSYMLDYREAWDRPAFSCFDIRSASVVRVDARFRFVVQVYGEVFESTYAPYRFLLKMGQSTRVVVLEASGGSEDSPGWKVRKGYLDDRGAPTEMAALCADCVAAQGDTLSFEVTAADLGAPSSFSWAAQAALKFGPVEMNDRSPDGNDFAPWPGQAGTDACSCNRLGVLADRLQYKLEDEVTITLFITKDAQVQLTDTSGGATSTIWTGPLTAGVHDLSSILFPQGGKLLATYPLGPEEVAMGVTMEGSCGGRAVARFEVVQ